MMCSEPSSTCQLCPRLADFRSQWASAEPAWFNAPVPSFGVPDPRLLIVGLAPGLRGANRTGRPFTGDYAGDLLYATLIETGFAKGPYGARIDDGLQLVDCLITNAVRCVPPQNKPTPAEIKSCGQFLASRIAATPSITCILALGRIAHESTLAALDQRKSAHPFKHGAAHTVGATLTLFDSFHCSRYNTNTRVLTPDMFRSVFNAIREQLSRS